MKILSSRFALPVLLFCTCPALLFGQNEAPVQIQSSLSGSTYTISIDPDDLPTLQGDGSGNDAYYSYYWEFGDYRFMHSISPTVEHVYDAAFNNKEVEIRLYLKAHYALSPKIVREPLKHTLTVANTQANMPFEDVPEGMVWMSSSDFAPKMEVGGDRVDANTTHQIQEREDFVLIISLKAPPNKDLEGTTLNLHIPKYSDFFLYEGSNMDPSLASTQTTLTPGRRLPSRLEFNLKDFGDVNGTNLFLYLTPESSGKKPPFGKNIEMDIELKKGNDVWDEALLNLEVVESRDPNRILVSDTYVEEWKEFLEEGLTYRVDFQNYGTGTVENGIEVFVDLPEGADPQSLELIGYHSAACSSINPSLPPCDTIIDRTGPDQISINLDDAGLLSKDVDERKSKGFVTYKIKPKRNIGKCRWRSRAAVQFTSARKLARTNTIGTDFKGKFSLGLKAMYNYFPAESGISYYSAGLVLGSDVHCGSDARLSVMFGVEELDGGFSDLGNYYLDISLIPFRIEPLRIQNGAWNFLGFGVGAQFSMAFRGEANDSDLKRSNVWTGFGDVTLVSKRKGPRVGVQYHVPFAVRNFPDNPEGSIDFNKTHWQFYVTWAF